MTFSTIAKYGGLVTAAGALISFLFGCDYLFSSKGSFLSHITFCSGVLAAGMIALALGELAAQTKRRADADEEANRIAERRVNLEVAKMSQEPRPENN